MSAGVDKPWQPRVQVEKLVRRNVAKNKPDDKQLRQAQIGAVENDGSPSILEVILEDGTVERYVRPAIGGLSFIQLDQGP